MSTRVLLIDDDEAIADIVMQGLKNTGDYVVQHFGDGSSGLEYAKNNMVDVILLDVQLPGIRGTDILDLLKKDFKLRNIPVIMLTAIVDVKHKVKTLEGGAEDYLVKPFNTEELKARINVVIRRASHGTSSINRIELEGIVLDRSDFTVKMNGKELDVTRSEFEILYLMMQRPNWVVGLSQVQEHMERTTGAGFITENTLRVHITKLRATLGPKMKVKIETVPTRGYKFVSE
jgi:DNA-binding response OmpR family regulator